MKLVFDAITLSYQPNLKFLKVLRKFELNVLNVGKEVLLNQRFVYGVLDELFTKRKPKFPHLYSESSSILKD